MIINGLVKPIQKILVDIDRDDEIGSLLKSVTAMQNKLIDVVKKIQGNSNQISSAAQVSDTANSLVLFYY